MKIKRRGIIIFGVVISFLLLAPETVQASASISAIDTVVNFGTSIEVNGVQPNERITFLVRKPDSTSFEIRATADESGFAEAEVRDDQTRQAGNYNVSLEDYGAGVVFKVFPGEMDPGVSGIYSDKNIVRADGYDRARINVRITDEYGNALRYHEVKILSSRNGDRFNASSLETDENGLASFFATSELPGESTFTAVDESAAATLSARVQVTFTDSPRTFRDVGGDVETVLLAQASGSSGTGMVSRFEIENLAATVNINEVLSFRVRAVNSSGNTVNTYSGTVTFTSTDLNAQLPNTYTFVPSDQGSKTFDLSLSFRTVGSQRLTVAQQNNALIKGEKNIEVIQPRSSSSTSQVRITKPAAGTYSVNALDVEGEAGPNSSVKIYDNGQQIAEVQSNTMGRFAYRTSLLTDGQHTFNVESNGVQSAPVTVSIDSTPARVENVQIDPQTVAPGGSFLLSIRSDPNLNSIRATLGDVIADLDSDPTNPGMYSGNLTAPSQNGQYTINVIITDNMGNPTPATEVGRITVDSNLTPAPTYSASVPSKVRNVRSTPGNSMVRLNWDPAVAESGIASYRVYYGTAQNNINLIASSQGSSTSMDVSNLQNGTPYYFQIMGVDTLGNEGDNRSDVVSVTPQAGLSLGDYRGTSPVLCDPGPCPPDVPTAPQSPEDGPGVIGMVLASVIGGALVKKWKRKKNGFPAE